MTEADTDWTLSTVVEGPADAPALVLLHSLGSSHIMWDGVAEALRGRVRLIRAELPGHGGSDPAPQGKLLEIEHVVGALLRSLDELGVTVFHVGGLSLGGMVALATAEIAPERVITASVMSTGPGGGAPQAWFDKAELVRTKGTAVLVDGTFDRWFTPEFAQGRGRAEVGRIRQAFENCSDEGYAQCCEVLATTDLRPGLTRMTMPVLLVSGEDDQSLNWAAADALAEDVRAGSPDVVVEHLAGVRHMSAVEKPVEVATALSHRIGLD